MILKIKLNYDTNNTSTKNHAIMLKTVPLMAQITLIHNDAYYFTFSRTLWFLVMNEWYMNLPKHFWTRLSLLDIRYKAFVFRSYFLIEGIYFKFSGVILCAPIHWFHKQSRSSLHLQSRDRQYKFEDGWQSWFGMTPTFYFPVRVSPVEVWLLLCGIDRHVQWLYTKQKPFCVVHRHAFCIYSVIAMIIHSYNVFQLDQQ